MGNFLSKSINMQTKIRQCRGEFFLKINKRACTSIWHTRVLYLVFHWHVWVKPGRIFITIPFKALIFNKPMYRTRAIITCSWLQTALNINHTQVNNFLKKPPWNKEMVFKTEIKNIHAAGYNDGCTVCTMYCNILIR
mgnify:CR=1 FL=1